MLVESIRYLQVEQRSITYHKCVRNADVQYSRWLIIGEIVWTVMYLIELWRAAFNVLYMATVTPSTVVIGESSQIVQSLVALQKWPFL